MNEKAQELLDRLESSLVDTLGSDSDDSENGWGKYALCSLCYGERDGCVNESSPLWNDESLEKSIINMFYQFYMPVRDMIEEELEIKMPDWLKIVIEPSYEDTSFIVIYRISTRKVVYYNDIKAWNYQFDNPEELGEALLAVYEEIKQEAV